MTELRDSGFEIVRHDAVEINIQLMPRLMIILCDLDQLTTIMVVQRGGDPAELLDDVIVDRHNLFEHLQGQSLSVLLCLHDEVACLVLQLLLARHVDLHTAGDRQKKDEAQRQTVNKPSHSVAFPVCGQVLEDHVFYRCLFKYQEDVRAPLLNVRLCVEREESQGS